MTDLGKWNYLHKSRAQCAGCGKATRGWLVRMPEEIPCCPRCRDTHSKFEEITGEDRKSARVSSSRSRATEINIPAEEQLPPMLARAFKNVKPDHMKPVILSSDNWIVTTKYDGARITGYFRGDQVFYLTRNKSKATGLYVDKTRHLPHLQPNLPELSGTVFDGELLYMGGELDTGSVVTRNQLNATVALMNSDAEKSIRLQEAQGRLVLVIFDVLVWKGQDIRDLPLSQRMGFRAELVREIKKTDASVYFMEERWLKGTKAEKEAFYLELINDGQEGVLYKDLSAPYCRKATSRPISWTKRKTRTTVDAFISGFVPGEAGNTGFVGALEVSVLNEDGDPHHIASVSNLTDEQRLEISAEDGSLKPIYYDQVVEVSFQELSSRAARGRHAVLERWRPDKSAEECTIDAMTKS